MAANIALMVTTKIQILLSNSTLVWYLYRCLLLRVTSNKLFLKKNNFYSMRYILLLFCYVFSLSTFSQQIIQDDFEGNGTIVEWVGDDCGLVSSFSNPYVQGINTSDKVLKYIDTGGRYANVRFDTNQNIDLSIKNSFSFKIFVPSITLTGNQTNKVSVKLQNGSLSQPWYTQSEII